MIRRFGKPPQANKTYKRRAGVYAILPRNGDLLLTFQGGLFNELQLPGGGVENGENPFAALHREVREETGWTIGSPRRIGAFRRYTYMPEYDLWAEKICSIFIARPILRFGDPLEEDHSEVWAKPELAANELCNEGDRLFVKQVFRLL